MGDGECSAFSTIHSGLNASHSFSISPSTLIFDSGCSHDMTPHLPSLSHCVSPTSPITILTVNGSPMHIESIGSVIPSHLPICQSLMFSMSLNYLLSISQLGDSGFNVLFSPTICVVQDQVSADWDWA